MADNLTSRGRRATTAARLPALPASTATDPARRQWEEMVREWLEVRLGARGDFYERAVTHRELQEQLSLVDPTAVLTPEQKRLLDLIGGFQQQFTGLMRQFSALQTFVNNIYDNSNSEITNIYNQVRDVAVEDVAVFARDMLPTAAGGCSALTTVELSAGQPNYHVLLFDPTTQESADFHIMLPNAWVGRMFKVYVYWAHASGGTAFGVTWEVTSISTSNNESLIQTFPGGAVITDTGGTAGNLYIAELSAAVTVERGLNDNGDLLSLRVMRLPTHASDTLDIDAGLIAVRFTLTDIPFPDPTYDPYWADVQLLVQDGTDGGLVITDRSTFASSVTITNYATFSDEQQQFGNNTIKTTTVSAAIPYFGSNGSTSRFGRASGDKVTIECWAYIFAVENYEPSSFFFAWFGPGGRILEVGTTADTASAKLRMRNGEESTLATVSISAGAWHFVQLNIDNGAYTLDLDGVEAYSGTNTYTVGSAGDFSFFVAAQNVTGSSTGSSTEVWVSPLRFTKGVCRARGAVPTAAFPTR